MVSKQNRTTKLTSVKTYSARPSEVKRSWWLVDASEAPLGRLATRIATLLTGKEKPMFTHHIDCGDYVVVINADRLVVTGNKQASKKYYRHSGFPGGLTETTLTEELSRDSRKVIVKAVRGMLPVNKLRPERLKRLRVYTGEEHENMAQQPKKLLIKEIV